MATRTKTPNNNPGIVENPGQENIDDITNRERNPDSYDARHGVAAGDYSDPRGVDTAQSGDASDPRGKSPEAEEKSKVAHENQVGAGFVEPKSKGKAGGQGRFTRRQKIIGGAASLTAAGTIAFMMFFLPVLRLEGYLSGINQRVFGYASYAVEKRMEVLARRYLIATVIQLDTCKRNRVTTGCKMNYSNMGLAKSTFYQWRDARVEQKMMNQMGIKIQSIKNTANGESRVKMRDAKSGRELTFNEKGELVDGKGTIGDREFGNKLRTFMLREFRWKDTMYYVSVRKYMARKHNTKLWCLMACKTRDGVDSTFRDAKTRVKVRIVERVIYPFSPKLGFIMDCLVSGGDTGKGGACSSKALRQKGIDRETLSNDEIEDLRKYFTDGKNPKLSQIIIEKLVTKIVEKETAQRIVGAIPGVGLIYLALSGIDMLNQADKCLTNYCLSHYAADLNSQQYVEYYQVMRSSNDELKAGALSADETGALMDEFNAGGHPAEESLVYQTYNGHPEVVASLGSGKAYAATAQPQQTTKKDPYLCNNGQPIPQGQYVCPEKKVARTFAIEDIRNDSTVSGLIGILNTYQACPTVTFPGTDTCTVPRPSTIVHNVLQGVNFLTGALLGPVISTALDGIKLLPGVGAIITYATEKLASVMYFIAGKVFPLPVQVNSPGREKYDALEAGGEVSASEFGKGGYTDAGQSYGLGGQLLSTNQQSAILDEYNQQQQYDYSKSGLIAKLTNRDQPNSLANRLIAAAPVSMGQLSQKFSAMLMTPFSMMHISKPASAAVNLASVDAFGIPRFGYAANDPVFDADPGKYTPEYCDQLKTAWENSATEDTVTGIDEYSTTNPCLLEQSALEAGSAVFAPDNNLEELGQSDQSKKDFQTALNDNCCSNIIKNDLRNTAQRYSSGLSYGLRALKMIGWRHSTSTP